MARNRGQVFKRRAKLWQERAWEVILDYEKWKEVLIDAIPDKTYAWEEKRKLLLRMQKSEESIEQYIIDKTVMCKRFGLSIGDPKKIRFNRSNR